MFNLFSVFIRNSFPVQEEFKIYHLQVRVFHLLLFSLGRGPDDLHTVREITARLCSPIQRSSITRLLSGSDSIRRRNFTHDWFFASLCRATESHFTWTDLTQPRAVAALWGFSLWRMFFVSKCRDTLREKREPGSVWDLGAPGGPVDGSCWMSAPERWPGSLRTG